MTEENYKKAHEIQILIRRFKGFLSEIESQKVIDIKLVLQDNEINIVTSEVEIDGYGLGGFSEFVDETTGRLKDLLRKEINELESEFNDL